MHEGRIDVEIDIINDDLTWVDKIGRTVYDICSIKQVYIAILESH
jgi:hypothetical protein